MSPFAKNLKEVIRRNERSGSLVYSTMSSLLRVKRGHFSGGR